jgi:hypothetical protein
MDLTRLRTGELLAGVSAVALLALLFADWFGGESGWETMTVARVVLVATVLMALTLVVLTVTARPVAMPVAAGVTTVGLAALAVLLVVYRVVVNEPGPNAAVDLDPGAYLGLAAVLGIAAGAWRSMGDERTQAPASVRQTERVLAVRGAPRPAPPERDPDRPPAPSDPMAKPAEPDAPPA